MSPEGYRAALLARAQAGDWAGAECLTRSYGWRYLGRTLVRLWRRLVAARTRRPLRS